MKSKKIIVVDDDGLILGFMHGMFQKIFKSEVLIANSGTAAIKLAQNNAPIDLLITDIRMPEMDGVELGVHFAKHYPETNILFMSGYAEKRLDKSVLSNQKVAFIPKPFSFKELKNKLDYLLG